MSPSPRQPAGRAAAASRMLFQVRLRSENDERLTVAGEGPGVGPAYPRANAGGVVNDEASRTLADLLNAVNTFQGANLATVQELLAWLDLENRNAHMHVPFGPPSPAVNCGEIERIN